MKPWACTELSREREEAKDSLSTGSAEMEKRKMSRNPERQQGHQGECCPGRCSCHFARCLGSDEWVGDMAIPGGLDYRQF